jgi:hypothetical protein
MPSDQSRRRLLLGAGGVLLGGGATVFGGEAAFASLRSGDDPEQLGGDDLTAGTIPDSADTLLVVHTDRTEPPETVRGVAGVIADTPPFSPVPARVRGLVSANSSASVDAARAGKLAFVSSADGHGAVVVWADWTEDHFTDLLGRSGSNDPRRETRHGRPVYTVGETTGCVLADTAFVVGHPITVTQVIDVWHGDGEPVGEPTLSAYDRTERQSPARFSLGDLRLSCGCVTDGERRPAYDHVTRQYGSLSESGTLRVSLLFDSTDSASTATLVDALRADLGLEDGVSARIDLPSEAVSALSVREGDDAVTVRLAPDDTPHPSTLTDLLGGLSQLVSET